MTDSRMIALLLWLRTPYRSECLIDSLVSWMASPRLHPLAQCCHLQYCSRFSVWGSCLKVAWRMRFVFQCLFIGNRLASSQGRIYHTRRCLLWWGIMPRSEGKRWTFAWMFSWCNEFLFLQWLSRVMNHHFEVVRFGHI